jgi:hypothetical protein
MSLSLRHVINRTKAFLHLRNVAEFNFLWDFKQSQWDSNQTNTRVSIWLKRLDLQAHQSWSELHDSKHYFAWIKNKNSCVFIHVRWASLARNKTVDWSCLNSFLKTGKNSWSCSQSMFKTFIHDDEHIWERYTLIQASHQLVLSLIHDRVSHWLTFRHFIIWSFIALLFNSHASLFTLIVADDWSLIRRTCDEQCVSKILLFSKLDEWNLQTRFSQAFRQFDEMTCVYFLMKHRRNQQEFDELHL